MSHSLSHIGSRPDRQLMSDSFRMPLADAVVRFLEDVGIKYVFGLPGGATIPFHTSLEDSDVVEFVLTAHEGGASYMADCYARVSGQMAACCATTGPGATNLLTGIASAKQDSVPMLVLTGMNPIDTWGRGDFQECSPYWHLDTAQMLKSACKMSEVVVSEKSALHRLSCAIATARQGRPGPVHLAIPRDLWTKSVNYSPTQFLSARPHAPAPSQTAVDQAARQLMRAQNPLIIFGSGTGDAALAILLEISEFYAIPIVSTPRAKGTRFETCSKYYLGSMGISASPVVDQLFECTEFDVVLSVGAGMGSYATNTWDRFAHKDASFIQVNIDPNDIGRNYPCDLGIVSDAQTFAACLQERLKAKPVHSAISSRRAWANIWVSSTDAPIEPRLEDVSDGEGVHPHDIVRAVDVALGETGVVLADSSSILLWATHYLPERPKRRLVTVWGWASMGHVTAGAIGAKLAEPDADVVVLTGDGCFLMNGNEVATAASLNLPIVWVINANTQLGMIHYELRAHEKTRSATLRGHDFVNYARALGAHGVLCKDANDLAALISAGLSKDLPTVIQVETNPHLSPPMGNKKAGGMRWKERLADF